jgi:K+ transporter
VKGTAVFLTSDPIFVPTALLQIACAWRRSAKKFATVRLRFGYMRSPNVPRALAVARKLGWQFDILRLAPVSKTICPIRNAALAGPAVHCHEPFGQ